MQDGVVVVLAESKSVQLCCLPDGHELMVLSPHMFVEAVQLPFVPQTCFQTCSHVLAVLLCLKQQLPGKAMEVQM